MCGIYGYEQIVDALKEERERLSRAIDALGVPRNSVTDRIKKAIPHRVEPRNDYINLKRKS
jgi:hypothetical protein